MDTINEIMELGQEMEFSGHYDFFGTIAMAFDFRSSLHEAMQENVDPIPTIALILKANSSRRGRIFLPLLQDFFIACSNTYGTKGARVARFLLEHEPDIAKWQRSHGELLLHALFKDDSDEPALDILIPLIEANPRAVRHTDSNGLLPLHYACKNKASSEVIESLLLHYPEAAHVPIQGTKALPLHIALRQSPIDSAVVFILLDAFPKAASMGQSQGRLPLHIAISSGAPLKVIRRLIEIHPRGLGTRDSQSHIPLVTACFHEGVSMEVIKFLCDQCPDSTQSKGRFGRLPLHYAARFGTHQLVQFLIEQYPDAVSSRDNTGSLPIHYSCLTRDSLPIVQLLLDRYGGKASHYGGLAVVNNDGHTPLHCRASRSNLATDETLQLMIETYPAAIHVEDNDGMLPLHVACSCPRSTLLNIRPLVEADPVTIIRKTANESTPYQLAWRMHRFPQYLGDYLVETQTNVVQELKETWESVAERKLGLPDLVVARVWSFAKPDLWQPPL